MASPQIRNVATIAGNLCQEPRCWYYRNPENTFDCLRKGGRYVAVGLYGGELNLSIVPLIQRAITIQGSYVGTLEELKDVVALARDGKLASIPTATCSLAEVSSVLDRLKAGKVVGRVVATID